jgi:hypothetical protein
MAPRDPKLAPGSLRAILFSAALLQLLLPVGGRSESLTRHPGLSVPFVANAGQEDPRIAYSAATFAGRIAVTRSGEIRYPVSGGAEVREHPMNPSHRICPIGAHPAVTHVAFFVGKDPARWRSDLPTWNEVDLGEIWRRVTLELVAHGDNVEKVFTVEPGGRVADVRMHFEGGGRPRLDRTGALVLPTTEGSIHFTRPRAWQDGPQGRRPVDVAYRLSRHGYGFRLGAYDSSLPVVIDPLLQSTYGGGSNFDEAESMVLHPTSGDIYVCGRTSSADFNGRTGGARPTYADGGDAFVARYNAGLTSLLQATYFGGSMTDDGQSIAVHPTTGEIYVGGRTGSSDLPGTTSGAQASFSGQEDGFVAHFNAGLTTLVRATYIGGTSGITTVQSLAIHPTAGQIYAAGRAGANLPATTGSAQASGAGAYAARMPSDLGSFTQVTYIGSESAAAQAVAIEPASGDIFVAGTIADFALPARIGGAQEEPANSAGGDDGYVIRINGTLTSFVQSTYFGGTSFEEVWGMVFRASTSEVLITGDTYSTDLPALTGGAKPIKSSDVSGREGYVVRIAADLKSFGQATYVGGLGSYGLCLALNTAAGDVVVGGITADPALSNVAGGIQTTLLGFNDGFLSRLNGGLTTFLQNTYLGGSAQSENIYSIAFAPATSQLYAAGSTESNDFPGTAGGAQPGKNPSSSPDLWVARMSADLKGPVGAQYYTVAPCRLADTRGAAGPVLSAGSNRTFAIWTHCGVPSTASAASFNFTIVGPTAGGDIRTFPGGASLPASSTLNYRAGQTRANNAVLKLGASGDITVHVDQAGGSTTHLIVDVTGYFQ